MCAQVRQLYCFNHFSKTNIKQMNFRFSRSIFKSSLVPTSSLLRRLYSNQNCTDAELHYSFQGILPKLLALARKFTTLSGIMEYFSLFKKGVIDSASSGLFLYAHLQNPLLGKYGFDASEFQLGAMKSFDMIEKIINSRDFINYSLGETEDEPDECVSLLKHSIDTDSYCLLLNFKRETTLHRRKSNENSEMKYEFNTPSKFKAITINIDSVTTRVVEEGTTDTAIYPIGSIVASVDTFLTVEESLTLTRTDPHIGKIITLTTNRANWMYPFIFMQENKEYHGGLKFMRLTFESCISGQVDWAWKIRDWTIAVKKQPFSYKILTFP